tara:strand:+ start:850 stop:1812 length:963 start_codon:yes stop_codon:yes gene_type:complete
MYLEVNNLVKYYKKENLIIKKLNFSVKKGEIISFLGESGSGKTTFLKCLAGLEMINSGSVRLNGRILNDKNHFVIPQKRNIGFVFQDYPLFPHLNLKDNILFNIDIIDFKKLDYMLSLSGLKHLVNRFPHELSGGEQQRACVARALIREPDLLLLDEPFSNLDSEIKESMREEIHGILKETNTTTILVTHDINDALNIADRILIFKAGILQQYDDPINMYCEPVNCYCAKILGDLNKILTNGDVHYLRPENFHIVKKSKHEVLVEKSFFQGKEYKIKGSCDGEKWTFFSSLPLETNQKVYVDYKKEDLIYFDSMCRNFFE